MSHDCGLIVVRDQMKKRLKIAILLSLAEFLEPDNFSLPPNIRD